MIDLSREMARNTYHKNSNPDGIIDLGSAENHMMLDALQTWAKSHETADDRRNCNLLSILGTTLADD